ncbi:PAS domain S-box-containing protein [Kineococcus rhizosphaerae]|uniref:PAS domain S-box-containing protein n=1 Tax=Kineococcus rhizosphaerae TaxID=559628 RepID=A0A2T0R4T1_9ACTN|nr:PAS domain S-box-containing protein [Kineococcus rhizosphaerae]
MDLPAVAHDFPAAVLVVDIAADQVVFGNDLARQLAPDLSLPVSVEDWSRAAGLQVASGGPLGQSSTPLSQVAAGDPESGRQVSAALRSDAAQAREALWAIGVPLRDAPPPLRTRSLLVLMPLRFPDAVADVQAAAAAGRAHRSVLSSGLAMTVSDPTVEGDPLVWVSPTFTQLTGYTPTEAVGRELLFWTGPDTDAHVLARLRDGLRPTSPAAPPLEVTADETVSETVLAYRHDGSAFYNHLTISPVLDDDGATTHRVSVHSDVTAQVLAARERDRERRAAREQVESARQAQAAAEDAGRFGHLLLTLSEALTATTTVAEVAATIAEVVVVELGAAGSGLLLADPARTRLDFVTLNDMPAGTDTAWSRISWNEDAPLALAVRQRHPVFYRDDAALRAAHPAIVAHAEVPAMGASANLPLVSAGEVIGAVFLFWDRPQDLNAQQQAALQALARYTAQAVQRAVLAAERRTAAEVLQRSLLTRLPEPDHLELRSRYVPASAGEHVGGDWYDAVLQPDGATMLVIGDVTGHDMAAAAHMGQMRGLLRAFAYDRNEPPTQVVTRLDRTLAGLGIEGLATLIVARIEQVPADTAQAGAAGGAGVRRLRWTNAGHPPPLLLLADGSTQVLTSEPEILIGLLPDAVRSDHLVALPPASTLLLYTDGLIEHRGRSLEDGVNDLRRVLSACRDHTVQELLDRVVVELVGDSPEDDCAILAVRAHPEDRPRPVEAGPPGLT